ncbi:MAG: TonB-dependent receptor plug domain-containing protein [Leptolyngbyaceae cyanobacterium CRU_2_3]|nr:TonB-dependent receptor plug domain-containing protein [Leptolyngbyaceae cyanobacterium CRU_2_3]
MQDSKFMRSLGLTGAFLLLMSSSSWANEKRLLGNYSFMSEHGLAMTLTEWEPGSEPRSEPESEQLLAQVQSAPVEITSVRLNSTETGLEVFLETATGLIAIPPTTTVGEALVVEIPNTTLANEAFQQDNPTAGISSVTVMGLPDNRVQVVITGSNAPPTATIRSEAQFLVLVVTSDHATQQSRQEPLQIVVTDELEAGYSVPNASSATRTNTPIRDVPASIQVVPQQVIEDQQATRLEEALRNVSGVTFQGTNFGRTSDFAIRGLGGGFSTAPILRDGFRVYSFAQGFPELANLERIEVLKGPASILYGDIQPGGAINLVTKQPLNQPFYEAELQVGNRELIRPRFDLTGPLTPDGSLLYRLNGLYQHDQSFRDFSTDRDRLFIAPTLTWRMSPDTDLQVSLDYVYDSLPADSGIPAYRGEVAPIPRSRIINEPDGTVTNESLSTGYNLEHRFSDDWRLRNAFRYIHSSYDYNIIALPLAFDEATATVTRFW